jgi:hypothetical protein
MLHSSRLWVKRLSRIRRWFTNKVWEATYFDRATHAIPWPLILQTFFQIDKHKTLLGHWTIVVRKNAYFVIIDNNHKYIFMNMSKNPASLVGFSPLCGQLNKSNDHLFWKS